MAEEKKVEKPFVDPFTLMKTEELLAHYDKHFADTPEDAARREGYEHEIQANLNLFQDVQNSYLINKRGKGTKGNTPKKFALDKKNVNVESSELINKILMTLIEEDTKDAKGQPNKAILELYKNDVTRLKEYAAGKGINYEKVKQDLIENYANINKSKEFNNFKNTISQMLIKDLQKLQRVGYELQTNNSHHSKIKSYINSKLQKSGYTLEETVGVGDQIQHYQRFLEKGGKVTADDAHIYGNDLKKYEAPKPK